ncbi:MAG: NUDIX hydrolase [Desulfobacteraceae bacterium]|nr:NUDIX hydrolase [Desulfobacteraceae bacterium]
MNGRRDALKTAKVESSKEVFRGRSFGFGVEDVTLPNGVRTSYAMVRHPGSTGIVALSADGMVLMTHQYRHVIGRYVLEIPSGTMEKGEEPLACARRELEEETGYVAGSIEQLGAVHIMPAYSDELIHIFLATDLKPSVQNLDTDEIIEVRKYPFRKLMELIEDGTITDGLTILALYRAGARLQSAGDQ